MPKISCLAAGVVMACTAVSARAQNPFEAIKEFSATMVLSGAPSSMHQGQGEAKIYRTGIKIRTDLPGMPSMPGMPATPSGSPR